MDLVHSKNYLGGSNLNIRLKRSWFASFKYNACDSKIWFIQTRMLNLSECIRLNQICKIIKQLKELLAEANNITKYFVTSNPFYIWMITFIKTFCGHCFIIMFFQMSEGSNQLNILTSSNIYWPVCWKEELSFAERSPDISKQILI